MGAKCTIMMYGLTSSGKSHAMFGCLKQPGIVYKSVKDILGDKENGEEQVGMFVQVYVLEIYNEEIYDLLSCDKSGGSFNLWSKGSASKDCGFHRNRHSHAFISCLEWSNSWYILKPRFRCWGILDPLQQLRSSNGVVGVSMF